VQVYHTTVIFASEGVGFDPHPLGWLSLSETVAAATNNLLRNLLAVVCAFCHQRVQLANTSAVRSFYLYPAVSISAAGFATLPRLFPPAFGVF